MNIYDQFKQTTHPAEVNDYFHCFNACNILNVIYWREFFEIVRNVNGVIVECGVGRARSLITILALNRLYKSLESGYSRKVFGLDSFEGFPEPHIYDKSKRNPKKGEWGQSPNNQFKYTIDSIKEVIKNADLIESCTTDLKLVKGLIEDTTKVINVNKIAILHLDCDLFQPTLSSLNNLWGKIEIGGIVVIDDYVENQNSHDDTFPGVRKAINEFRKSNKDHIYKISVRGTPYLLRT